MSNRKTIFLKLAALAVIILGILLINSCGKMSPTSPENSVSDQPDPALQFGNEDIESKWGKIFYISLYDAAFGVVDEGGGAMGFGGFDYYAEFQVPADAVDDWTMIYCQASSYSTQSGLVYVFNFGPDGTVFETPATLRIEMAAIDYFSPDGVKYNGAELNFWNPRTQQWELKGIDKDNDGDGIIEFEVNHFSRYAIGGRLQ
jgi:hypothetical protein